MGTDYKVLLFGGTDEGHKIAEYLSEKKVPSLVCVATEYGEKVLSDNIEILRGRLGEDEMVKLMKKYSFSLCIDATHPYAQEVSRNIKAASETVGLKLFRIVRRQSEINCGRMFNSIPEIVRYIEGRDGNAFVTTGSKELPAFSPLGNRVYARVLPDSEVVKSCVEAGFRGRNLICMQGPFSAELNAAIMREIDAEFLVTKESGSAGGFDAKIEAAKKVGAEALVLKRPTDEKGIVFEEIFDIIEKMT